LNTTTPVVCPAGSYCPYGTKFATEHLCHAGTFSFTTGLQNSSECLSCTPGSYCGTLGLTSPTGKCHGGYFCSGGSSSATPNQNGYLSSYSIELIGEDSCVVSLNSSTMNDKCPPGHWCPVGSRSPIQCPPGTNSSLYGLVNVTQCTACPSGFYCPLNGTVHATRQCLGGYYCPSGTSNLGDDRSLLCPTGHYCPFGSSSPIGCASGSYQDETGQAICKVYIYLLHCFNVYC